jgi:bifunctional DNase/RNase
MDAVRMEVWKLSVDPSNDMPLILLRDQEGRETLPLWIGLAEASAIAAELEKIKLQRPMTHDLMKNMIEAFSIEVESVEVTEVRGNAFMAEITLKRGRETVHVEARPSDAIALALRTQSPIYVARRVLNRMRQIETTRKWLNDAADGLAAPLESVNNDQDNGAGEVDDETVRDYLASLSKKSFGKWKM